jgi:hypothetical protein
VHTVAGTSKAFSGVMAGSWGYRVRACNAAGCGAYSAIHTVWVDNIGGCNPPFCEDPDAVPGDPPVSW